MIKTSITKEEFLYNFPNYPEVSGLLNRANRKFSIFAGSEVWLLTNSRVPTDLDILVKNEDMEEIANLFNVNVETKSKKGVSANYFMIGNIEIVANIRIEKEEHLISVKLDDVTIPKMLYLNLEGLELPLLSPEDTLIIKSLLKRGKSENKFDLEDIVAVKSRIKLDKKYLRTRGDELGIVDSIENLLN